MIGELIATDVIDLVLHENKSFKIIQQQLLFIKH